MSTPLAVRVACLSRRGLGAAVALALSLTCIVFAAAVSVMPMTGMTDVADAATTAVPAVAVGAAVTSPVTGSLCEDVCVTDVSERCTVAGALAVTTLLALFLTTRRDTFTGLLPRARPRARAGRRRLASPWTNLSPISLCVLRV